MRLIYLGLCASALLACGDNVSPNDNAGPAAPAGELCIDGCGEKFAVATIPDAENLLRTSDKRLFVSGGTNVFEVRATPTQFEITPLSATDCNFTGLAQRGDTLYAACGDGQLYAAALTQTPALTPIHSLTGMALPNGVNTGPDDCLYIVDGPAATGALPSPQIVRVCFSADPQDVISQEVWLDTGLTAPNGIARRGETFYVTDGDIAGASSRVLQIPWLDGQPGMASELFTRASVFDDLSVFGEHLLVTDFVNGQILQLDLAGNLLAESPANTFASPSSVLVMDGPPFFFPLDVLVTEKGVIGDTMSNAGNLLSLFRHRPDKSADNP